VEAARERQRRRFERSSGLLSNADMGPAEVRDHCQVDDAGKSLLRAAMQQLHMSARAYDGLLKSPLHFETGAAHRRPGGE
jgi:magnesium chelatase family protein